MPMFYSFPQAALGGLDAGITIDLIANTINVALLTSSWTPSQGSNKHWSDINSNEVSGTGYTAGGASLGSKSLTVSGNTTTFAAANTTWSTSTITARYAAIYKNTGTASTSALIGYIDFGSNQSSSGGNFTIAWNASGILTLPVT